MAVQQKFKQFKPQALQRIARTLGYTGDMGGFNQYLDSNVSLKTRMKQLEDNANELVKNSNYQQSQQQSNTVGAFVPPPKQTFDTIQLQEGGQVSKFNLPQAMVNRALQPGVPVGGDVKVSATPQGQGQVLPQTTAQVGQIQPVNTQLAGTYSADPINEKLANKMQAVEAAPAVDTALNSVQAAQTNPDDPRAKVVAAEQTQTTVGNIKAAQGNATLLDNPVQRQIQQGEIIQSVANAEKAAQFSEQIQAAEATPTKQATVAGQLETLMQQFEGGKTPAWAAGALRSVSAQMATRGLGASSIAAQAMVQAAMESALPIAQADAQTRASFEVQNLSNRQQRAMLGAEQRAAFMGQEFDQMFQTRVQNSARIADIANINFNAEQQIALENSRLANTMNLQNLSNTQATVMAEAAALSNLELTSLNNRQQSAVQNAQNFLQMDMTNLSNQQATQLFKAQQRVQSLFTDQAAENASRQFNATSQNQTDQFFANLVSQTKQFNTAQANAQEQFNSGEINALEKFNQEINNQRDQYNATNQLQIAQSNAVWRREIATADTLAVNRANELNASSILDISKTSYDNLWSYYQDTMEYAWKAADNELDRMNNLAVAQLDADATVRAQKLANQSAAGGALGGLIGTLGTAYMDTLI